MPFAISYSFADATSSQEGRLEEFITDDLATLISFVQKLNTPHARLFTKPSTFDGTLDFIVLDDLQIEIEIVESFSDFGLVDIPTAECIIKIALHDHRSIPFREKLTGISVAWLT